MCFECPAFLPALHVHQRAARSVIHSDPTEAINFPYFCFLSIQASRKIHRRSAFLGGYSTRYIFLYRRRVGQPSRQAR